ncbi:MAG: TauD/TfdA family dioxygenase, partial [Archangium sp.]
MMQFFSCLVAAQQGGETPLVDCRRVYQRLRPELRERLAEKKLRYVRNFIESVDVSWSRFFNTTDRQQVERYCRAAGMGFEWRPDNGLRTWRVCQAVARHPRTGEHVFFNQLSLHHISCVEPQTRDSLRALYGEEGLPRNVSYGDGTPLEDEVVAEVREVLERESVAFPWRAGDILVLDNMLVAHARRPFVGPRKVVVALGSMMSAEQLVSSSP